MGHWPRACRTESSWSLAPSKIEERYSGTEEVTDMQQLHDLTGSFNTLAITFVYGHTLPSKFVSSVGWTLLSGCGIGAQASRLPSQEPNRLITQRRNAGRHPAEA